MSKNRSLYPLVLLVAFIVICAGAVNRVNAVEDPIEPITYKAQKNPNTGVWCCYMGTTGCVPSPSCSN